MGNTDAMIQDLEFLRSDEGQSWYDCGKCKVHRGFLHEWYSLKSCIHSKLSTIGCGRGSYLYVTGHSLGAAVSALAVMSLWNDGWGIAETYNFGMPRVGDNDF